MSLSIWTTLKGIPFLITIVAHRGGFPVVFSFVISKYHPVIAVLDGLSLFLICSHRANPHLLEQHLRPVKPLRNQTTSKSTQKLLARPERAQAERRNSEYDVSLSDISHAKLQSSIAEEFGIAPCLSRTAEADAKEVVQVRSIYIYIYIYMVSTRGQLSHLSLAMGRKLVGCSFVVDSGSPWTCLSARVSMPSRGVLTCRGNLLISWQFRQVKSWDLRVKQVS